MHAANPCRSRSRGFSLIEMVAAIVLTGIVLALVTPALVGGLRAFDATAASQTTLSKLRYATERMAREIREVRRDPASPSNYQMTMAPTSLTFTKTAEAGVATTVTITRSGANVTLQYIGGSPAVTAVLTDQATDLTFKYYRIDGTTETADTTLVAYVDVLLQLTKGGAVYDQRTRVSLRNLM